MNKKNILTLISLVTLSIIIIIFSSEARNGAIEGLALAENTIIPSLLPLLIIFYMIMKSSAKDIIAKSAGCISTYIFNLPQITFPAILFGLVGGYPTGALLTNELLSGGEIDEKQARRLLRFNFCGGCGFIITAVGSATMGSLKKGTILFLSNILSAITIGIILSFTEKREYNKFYSFSENKNISDILTDATNSAVKSVLNITAFIILFCAINNIINLPQSIMPFIEITSGICGDDCKFSLPQISAYLSFGGICIHFQILQCIGKAKMKYTDFLFFRIFSALLSYCYTKLILIIFPAQTAVFSNSATNVAQFSSVNLLLSCLMVAGSFIFIADLSSKKFKTN